MTNSVTQIVSGRRFLGQHREVFGYATIYASEICKNGVEFFGLFRAIPLEGEKGAPIRLANLDNKSDPWALLVYTDSYWDIHIIIYNTVTKKLCTLVDSSIINVGVPINATLDASIWLQKEIERVLPDMIAMAGA